MKGPLLFCREPYGPREAGSRTSLARMQIATCQRIVSMHSRSHVRPVSLVQCNSLPNRACACELQRTSSLPVSLVDDVFRLRTSQTCSALRSQVETIRLLSLFGVASAVDFAVASRTFRLIESDNSFSFRFSFQFSGTIQAVFCASN